MNVLTAGFCSEFSAVRDNKFVGEGSEQRFSESSRSINERFSESSRSMNVCARDGDDDA